MVGAGHYHFVKTQRSTPPRAKPEADCGPSVMTVSVVYIQQPSQATRGCALRSGGGCGETRASENAPVAGTEVLQPGFTGRPGVTAKWKDRHRKEDRLQGHSQEMQKTPEEQQQQQTSLRNTRAPRSVSKQVEAKLLRGRDGNEGWEGRMGGRGHLLGSANRNVLSGPAMWHGSQGTPGGAPPAFAGPTCTCAVSSSPLVSSRSSCSRVARPTVREAPSAPSSPGRKGQVWAARTRVRGTPGLRQLGSDLRTPTPTELAEVS